LVVVVVTAVEGRETERSCLVPLSDDDVVVEDDDDDDDDDVEDGIHRNTGEKSRVQPNTPTPIATTKSVDRVH
jgi:hypothetical protein